MASLSRDGYQWTATTGLTPGVPTIGLIEPSFNTKGQDQTYDLIIVGAGYAALTAARDATLSGLKVLLLEARDRIGGRSWSSNIGGYPFEMGGTWVHWAQPQVWREICRYNLRSALEVSPDYTSGRNTFSLYTAAGGKDAHELSHAEEDALMISSIEKFFNVDGHQGRSIMPRPHDEFHSPDVRAYDDFTAADRLAQIKDELTGKEEAVLKAWLLLMSGASLETSSFYEHLHWWSLCEHSYKGAVDFLIKYKFRDGQSAFALKFWNEALSTGNLHYLFNTPISTISDSPDLTTVTSIAGIVFKARKVISTVPLNVLSTITFSSPLPDLKAQAIATGHIQHTTKLHAEVSNTDLRSWSVINPSSKLVFAFGDGTTPAGNTHIVGFGANSNRLDPELDIEATKKALTNLTPMHIERLVFHNWSKDQYAKGAWFFPGKSFVTRFLGALRERHGNVHFASSDWAVGWRSFIDGAIEEGGRCATEVVECLRVEKKKKLEAR
ncbi:putative polyamine oxidase [Cadophora sp. MPI-SDFR-AT-0126]|nr:putative polyamine oxidase [Leotiomycetes sp. MPI-SDFR-AT-0126]